ncbi:serine hydrolase [Ralstonia pseudosolanacearum]
MVGDDYSGLQRPAGLYGDSSSADVPSQNAPSSHNGLMRTAAGPTVAVTPVAPPAPKQSDPDAIARVAEAIDLFPTIKLPVLLNVAALNAAARPVTTTPAVNELCAALVDLTDNPANPPFFGMHENDMLYPASLCKVLAMYAAFALKDRIQALGDAARNRGAPVTIPAIATAIEAAWRPRLKALFPKRPENLFRSGQDIVVPKLGTIFDLSPSGQVKFKGSASDAELDRVGIDGRPPNRLLFLDWLKLAMRWSNDAAAGRVIDALGYFYINGALANAGFFDSGTSNGLWLSADYAGHDWVRTLAEKSANASGQKLTPHWATVQGRLKSNITGTAKQVASLLTLMAQDHLIDATSSQDMRALMDKKGTFPGTRSFINEALGGATASLACKIGIGDDGFNHDCGIVERTVGGKYLRYAVVGLGSPPAQNLSDLSKLFVMLDQAIAAQHP